MAKGIRVNVNHRATIIIVDDLATVAFQVQRSAKNTGDRSNRHCPPTGHDGVKLHPIVTDGARVVGENRPEFRTYQWWQPITKFRHVHIDNGNDFLTLVRPTMPSAIGIVSHRSHDHVVDDEHSRVVSIVKTCHHFAAIHRSPAELESVGINRR